MLQAGKAAGIDGNILHQLVESCSSQEVKNKLKEVTQEALDLGVGHFIAFTHRTYTGRCFND